ncbi:MAG: type II toxin-antitoxin system prevent-host-death family antitoxin [Bryobacteraceae bacterium]|nr:type II toxin-antitoxin system prevent-host-death family antitoxin [Bryobacteraceae bacterium]
MLLDRVERGEEITITRRGKPVARLVRIAARIDEAQPRAALERIRTRVGTSFTSTRTYRAKGLRLRD